MSNILVSVIIPTFNYGHLILESLISIRDQSLKSWECLIIDDGSTDETRKIVNDFILDNSAYNFKYYRIKNSGTSAAKNYGLDLASGKYIQFLDADDLLALSKLENQSGYLEKSGDGLVFSDSLFFIPDEKGKKYIERYPKGYLAKQSYQGEELLKKLIKNNLFTISSPLIRYEAIKGQVLFEKDLRNNEDWLFWFKLSLIYPKFNYCNMPGSEVFIRVHNQSAMNQKRNMYEGEVAVRRIMDSFLQGHLKDFNLDLLSLHNIRSLSARDGYLYIGKRLVKNPIKGFDLFKSGVFRSFIRIYRNLIG